MQQNSPELDIINHFRIATPVMEEESAILDAAIRDIVIGGNRVTSKAIILHLIAEMESTTDVIKLDVLRTVLEVVVGRTPDDEGF